MRQIAAGPPATGDRSPTGSSPAPCPAPVETAEIVAEVLGIADRLEIARRAPRRDTTAAAIRDWLRDARPRIA